MVIKRVLFSEDNNNKGSVLGTGAKVLGGAAALAGGFAAAKHGMLGNSLAKGANKMWASAGKTLGSASMVESGATGYGKAAANQYKANFTKRYGTEGARRLTEQKMTVQANKYADKIRKANQITPPATT